MLKELGKLYLYFVWWVILGSKKRIIDLQIGWMLRILVVLVAGLANLILEIV